MKVEIKYTRLDEHGCEIKEYAIIEGSEYYIGFVIVSLIKSCVYDISVEEVND